MKQGVRVAALAAVLSVGRPQPAAADGATIAATINVLRGEAGLPPLAIDPALSARARAHSLQMAHARRVFHHPQLPSLGPHGYVRLAQFQAGAPSQSLALATALSSLEHREQILGAYDRVGIGVAVDDGYAYVTWFFLKACE